MSGRDANQLAADVLKERVLLAFVGPHVNHPGIPGAPEGVLCPRCIAERALDELVALVGTLQQERDGLRTFLTDLRAQMEDARAAGQWPLADVVARAEAAEAALATAQEENANLVRACNVAVRQSEQDARALATTRQALTEILTEEGYGETPAPIIVRNVRDVARRALAAADGDTKEPA